MPTAALHAINAYTKVGIETGITGANPHRLVLMLFEGAILAITDAKQHMLRGELAAKGESVSKAIMIINDGLRASLDVEAGGEIAVKLHALYEYMSSRLLIANFRNQPEALDEVNRLLGGLRGAWEAIDGSNGSRVVAASGEHQLGAVSSRRKA